MRNVQIITTRTDWDNLLNLLEDSGFESCEHNVGLEDEEEYVDWFWDETIYDLQGRVLKEIPKSGFYIKGGKKYCVIKW